MLEVNLMGAKLEHPVMNSAGTCKTLEDVRKFSRSAVSAVNIGSATLLERAGNSGKTYWSDGTKSLNSIGLRNGGKPYYQQHLGEMVSMARAAGKPVIFSVAGFSPGEYAELALLGCEADVDFVELNLGCPNIWGHEGQKAIPSANQELTEAVLAEVYTAIGAMLSRTIVKVTPLEPDEIRERSLLVVKYGVGVAAVNTDPNRSENDDHGQPVIDARDDAGNRIVVGGMAGKALYPKAATNVLNWSEAVGDDWPLIGIGGVNSGAEVGNFLSSGAVAVALATRYFDSNEDPGVFGDILADYLDLLEG